MLHDATRLSRLVLGFLILALPTLAQDDAQQAQLIKELCRKKYDFAASLLKKKGTRVTTGTVKGSLRFKKPRSPEIPGTFSYQSVPDSKLTAKRKGTLKVAKLTTTPAALQGEFMNPKDGMPNSAFHLFASQKAELLLGWWTPPGWAGQGASRGWFVARRAKHKVDAKLKKHFARIRIYAYQYVPLTDSKRKVIQGEIRFLELKGDTLAAQKVGTLSVKRRGTEYEFLHAGGGRFLALEKNRFGCTALLDIRFDPKNLGEVKGSLHRPQGPGAKITMKAR